MGWEQGTRAGHWEDWDWWLCGALLLVRLFGGRCHQHRPTGEVVWQWLGGWRRAAAASRVHGTATPSLRPTPTALSTECPTYRQLPWMKIEIFSQQPTILSNYAFTSMQVWQYLCSLELSGKPYNIIFWHFLWRQFNVFNRYLLPESSRMFSRQCLLSMEQMSSLKLKNGNRGCSTTTTLWHIMYNTPLRDPFPRFFFVYEIDKLQYGQSSE